MTNRIQHVRIGFIISSKHIVFTSHGVPAVVCYGMSFSRRFT